MVKILFQEALVSFEQWFFFFKSQVSNAHFLIYVHMNKQILTKYVCLFTTKKLLSEVLIDYIMSFALLFFILDI